MTNKPFSCWQNKARIEIERFNAPGEVMNENITPLHIVVWSAAYLHIYPDGVTKGRPVAKVPRDQENAYGLAAYIAEACNAYPALTARVKELEEALVRIANRPSEMTWGEDHEVREAMQEMEAIADAALNKEPT